MKFKNFLNESMPKEIYVWFPRSGRYSAEYRGKFVEISSEKALKTLIDSQETIRYNNRQYIKNPNKIKNDPSDLGSYNDLYKLLIKNKDWDSNANRI